MAPILHALLGASSASRWLQCTPSARLEANYENTTSIYAQEGTVAHELGELLISYFLTAVTSKEGKEIAKRLFTVRNSALYNPSMEQHAESYREFVLERLNEAKAITKDAILLMEQKLDFSNWVPEGFGTGDAVIIADGTLNIIDLKYGQGVEVSAVDNKQMMLYALGAINEFSCLYDIRNVVMTIFQPRLDNFSHFEMTVIDLLSWANNELKAKAELAFAGDGEFTPGKHCHFCRAKCECKALATRNLEVTKPEMKDSNLMSDEDIVKVLDHADEIKKWLSAVEEYALTKAVEGKEYPGYKLVEGRSNRCYSDANAVADALLANDIEPALIYTKSLKTITSLEKDLGKKVFNEIVGDLIIKPQGKPTLVPESDKRPPLNNAVEDFKNEVIND